jgi:phosphoglycerate dehydrogenase-like enzyme
MGELEEAAGPLGVLVTSSIDRIASQASEVEAAARVSTDTLKALINLRWYHNWFAGVEHLVSLPRFRDGHAVLTNASGTHAQPMAEQFFALLLAYGRNLPALFEAQQRGEWLKGSMSDVFELDGRTLLVIGLGAIGRRIAELGTAFSMNVIGVRKHPDGSEPVETIGAGDLFSYVGKADVIVSVLPFTEETDRFFDAGFFSTMKPGAIFSNFGRGTSVDQHALVAALDAGKLGAALLDVTDPEPLPPDHPLWKKDNVLITPHTGGWTSRYSERTWPTFVENVRRYVEGEPLINQIDVSAGY